MHSVRMLALIVVGVAVLCLFELRPAHTQSSGLRRITNTTEEGINLNPSLSGDGKIVAFESTEDVAGAGGTDHFRAIRANVSVDPPTFFQMSGTRTVAPAISQDGSHIAFAAKDDPLGTNPDGNAEIFLFDGARLHQVTNTSPGDLANRATNGNFQPSISDDGRFIAFSSNRDLAGQNSDGNLEIFVYDSVAISFAQLTNSAGTVGCSEAKISGNGASIAYIRDTGAVPSASRDLLRQPRASQGPTLLLAANVQSLAMTYGRAISDDGTRVVFSGETDTDSSQVFLYDGRGGSAVRQITSLSSRVTEVPLHPTISGDGSRIAFATRRHIPSFTYSDSSIELYTYDIPTVQFARVTDAPAEADGFDGSLRVTEVVSSLNDDGSIIAFNFPRALSGPVTAGLGNRSEIYLTATAVRPPFGTLTAILNGASFGNEPSPKKAIAPGSIAVARGTALTNSTVQSQRLPNGTFPTNVAGTTVTVNGRPAQIFFISPSQINFLVPAETEIGNAQVVVTNSDNFSFRGSAPTLRAAPGIFTKSADGIGEGTILNADTLQEGPFDPSKGNLRLSIFTTGARNAIQTLVTVGDRLINAESVIASAGMPGLDEVRVRIPADLHAEGPVTLLVQSDGRDSNPVTVTFIGDSRREIIFNEILADPPGSAGDLKGDANHDGVRDSSDDEFVELVNVTSPPHDVDISGYQLFSRSSSATVDRLRFTFAPNTILPACSAVVVFGGGSFNSGNPVFGGAQVFKATTGLSLSNTGGVITLRDSASAVVGVFQYGGATGLNGGANQSLTRSPDVIGAFTRHTTASGSGGTAFSPGTRVNGSAFDLCPPVARIEVTPSAVTIDAGAKQQFIAHAYAAGGKEIAGVIFSWESSNPSVATIDNNGLATSSSAGSTEISALGRGVRSAPAKLTTRSVQRVLTRIDVTPSSATIPATGAQQFTAHGFDQFDNEIPGLTFTWESTALKLATVDQAGVATGVTNGQTTIRAFSQSKTGTASLTVTPAIVIINEVLADPSGSKATDLQGDANHDGVRSGSEDEFVELVNSTGAGINISGWTVLTHSSTSTRETKRHTFAANTTLRAGQAIVVFGGGTFNPSDGVFGCAQVVKASSGRLSLTNTALTVRIRDGSGNLVTQLSYGSEGNKNQSLTRSPDVTGPFEQHTTATGAGGRRFSPGVKLNGTPFGNCTVLTISDAGLIEGNSGTNNLTFTVALSKPAPNGGVKFDIATQDGTATVANHDYIARNLVARTIPAGQQTYQFDVTVSGDRNVEPNETFFVNVTNVTGANVADGLAVGTILDDDSPVLSINDVSANEGDTGTSTFTFTISSTLPAPSGGITFDIATVDGAATAASGDYKSRSLIHQTMPAGQQTYTFDVTVNGDTRVESDETFLVNISNASANASLSDSQGTGTIQNDDTALLVISQVYGGGNNSGAPFRNDFVEIYNRGTTTVDFAATPYSVQYASVGSNFGTSKTNLTAGTIAPGRYFLVKEGGGTTNGAALPTPDASGSMAMGATSGKVALVAGTTKLTAATCPGDDGSSPFNPNNPGIADLVGYGSSAANAGHCYEGSGPANALSSSNANFRKAGGCIDTNQNAADFFVASPNPRNSSSPIGDCKPELAINNVSVTEGNTGTKSLVFTVTLSVSSGQTVTVDYATANGTATAPADYQAQTGTVTFNPGDLSQTITVLVNGDRLDEASEHFFVNLSHATKAVLLDNQGQGTIKDNDAAPKLSINDLAIAEGNSGAKPFTFTVSLSAASGRTVTVNYATADNTAAAGSDYQTTSGLLTFNPGDTSKTFTVLSNGDTTFEPSETFLVNLTTPTNAAISDSQGQGTIQNDDVGPTLSIDNPTITEGDSGTSIITFNVTLSPASASTVKVDYATANGTATTAGNDYLATSGTLTFSPGAPSKPIKVTIKGDKLVEPDEIFTVNLSNVTGGAIIGTPSGTGTIQNDDTALLVISQLYGGGGNSGATFQNDFVEIFNRGTTTVDFAVTPYSVQYASSTGSFTSGHKIDLTTGTISVGQYFLIKLHSGGAGGASFTADLTDTVDLSATKGKVALVAGIGLANTDVSGCPVNVAVADLVGYGSANCSETSRTAALSTTKSALRKTNGCTDTNNNLADFTTPTLAAGTPPRNTNSPIHDCNAPPDLTIDDVAVAEGNSGTTTFTFTVSLSAPAPAPVTFNIATQNGTATVAGNDYLSKSLTGQTIAAGQQTYTFAVTVKGDTNLEPNETFLVNVTNVSGATMLDGQGQGTIQNDDSPALSIDDVSASEGDSGTKTFTFHLTLSIPAGAGGVKFDIATADGTAQDHSPVSEDNDYVGRSLTNQTIPAGQSSYNFTVTVNGDKTAEANETFSVNASNVSGATVLDGSGTGTIQNDDTANLKISQVYPGGGLTGASFTNDFVELFNRGATTVDFSATNYSVQFLSTGGSSWTKTNLTSGTLAPGHYFLIKETGGCCRRCATCG
jgi:uncharacterized protein (TIGR03437 family)